MKAIVHIGTPKTGTTTAQARFSDARRTLLENGILYPHSLGANHHLKLATASRLPTRPERGFKMNDIKTEEDHAVFCSTLRSEFEAELATAKARGAHTCLISSEWLYDRLTISEEIARLKEFLVPLFEDVIVVVWLRPQVEFLLSLASTLCRNGGRVNKPKLKRLIASKETLYYNETLSLWEEVFGEDKVQVYAYTRQPDVVGTILGLAGTDAELDGAGDRMNSKLSVQTMAMANQIRVPHANRAFDAGWNRKRYFQEIDSTESLEIDLKFAKEIHAVFEKGNKALIARRADLSKDDLTPKWSRFGSSSNIELLEQDCAFSSELSQLITMMENELKIQQAQTEMALAEVQMLKSAPKAARRHLKEAKLQLKAASTGKSIPESLKAAKRKLVSLKEKARQ
ncbi:hypothetical protein [Hyphomonas atlantica]|nr:hypothetical protein [Hyphomonas atlantica]